MRLLSIAFKCLTDWRDEGSHRSLKLNGLSKFGDISICVEPAASGASDTSQMFDFLMKSKPNWPVQFSLFAMGL